MEGSQKQLQRLQLFRLLAILLDRRYKEEYLRAQQGYAQGRDEGDLRIKKLCQRYRIPVAYDPTLPTMRLDLVEMEDLITSRHGAVVPYLGATEYRVSWLGKYRSGEREVSGKFLLEVDLNYKDQEILEQVQAFLRIARKRTLQEDGEESTARRRLSLYLRIWELHNEDKGVRAIREALLEEGVDCSMRMIKRTTKRIQVLVHRERDPGEEQGEEGFPCHTCPREEMSQCPGSCERLEAYFASDPLTRDVTFTMEHPRKDPSAPTEFDIHQYAAELIDSQEPEAHRFATSAQNTITRLRSIDRQHLTPQEIQCLDAYMDFQSYSEAAEHLGLSRMKVHQVINNLLFRNT